MTPAPSERSESSGRWWRSHNVRVRLTLWYVSAMLVVLAVYAAVVFTFVRRNASAALDTRIRSDFQWASAMVDETSEGGIAWSYDDITDEESFWFQVWSPDGTLLYQNIEARNSPLDGSRELALTADDAVVALDHPVAPVRVLTRRGRIGDTPVVIQVARSEAAMRAELRQLALILAFGLPLAVAIAGLGGYTLARRALLPIERMTERARSITAERLHDRLPVHNPDDEMGRLATVFNETLARLEGSFDQMRRFTADVSHQLRTPLTAIRSVGEVGLREHRDEAAYRGIIGSMLEEADRLASLVDRLLMLSRAETGDACAPAEVFDLSALAEEVAGHLEVLAEEKRQSIVCERVGGRDGVQASADRFAVRQALINLVDNAIKFSPAGGEIRIRVQETRDEAIVEVADSGAGIDSEARARIFDRFYRAADAETPGAGLGLSIAKGAVEASGGRLRLAASGPSGSTFQIALPRAKPSLRRAAV
ncbi:MAG: HAMP domain-containing protein [Acidobacteria bacterium]|nr:HAMP domain-containing protein [Acidobacteriota bacterium]